MYPVSQKFLDALRDSHRVVVKAEVYDNGQLVRILPVVAGSATVDSTGAVRRTCRLTVVDEDGTLVPKYTTDPLTPYGNELKLYRGVAFASGSPLSRSVDLQTGTHTNTRLSGGRLELVI